MNHFQNVQINGWSLSVNPDDWNDKWRSCIESYIKEDKSDWRDSRHARSKFIELPGSNKPRSVQLKLYKKPTGLNTLKESMRESKHRRAFRITQELSKQGLLTPSIYICGDITHDAYCGLLVTEKLPYIDLSQLPNLLSSLNYTQRKTFKRTLSTTLGQEIGKLHNLGYVHGDLVATNILTDPNNPRAIVFIDHDRSAHCPKPMRNRLQMRNLIQVNRHAIDGICHSDRLRAFLAYANTRQWKKSQTEKMMREIANGTVRRRLARAKK